MRAGHAAHVDAQAALELARQERPATASQSAAAGAAFALANAAQAGSLGLNASGVDPLGTRNGTTQSAVSAQSASTRASGAALPSDRATASSTGSLLQQLQQLSQTAPARFQQATSAIASQLQSVAGSTSEANAQALAPLIDSFRAAAQSGQPPSLQSLQTTSSAAGTHPSVRKYAQGSSATAGAFSLEALHDAMQSALL